MNLNEAIKITLEIPNNRDFLHGVYVDARMTAGQSVIVNNVDITSFHEQLRDTCKELLQTFDNKESN